MHYPNATWVADLYRCPEGHVTERFHLPNEAPWDGVVACKTCGSRETTLFKSGVTVKPEEFKPATFLEPRSNPGTIEPTPAVRTERPAGMLPDASYADLFRG